MSTQGFRQAGIPTELADEIMSFMKRHPWLGTRSLSSFATDACRERLLELMDVVERRGSGPRGASDDPDDKKDE